MNTLEILTAARALIASPDNWTTGLPARDKHNHAADTWSKHAVRFCALGACHRAGTSRTNLLSLPWDLLVALEQELPKDFWFDSRSSLHPVAQYNDTHTHAEVLALFDRAIAAERARLNITDAVGKIIKDALDGARQPEVVE